LLCKIVTLRKRAQTSNASRKSKYFYFKFKIQTGNVKGPFAQLTFCKHSQSGRGATGRRIIRSKGAILTKFRKIRINYGLRYIKLGTIVAFKFLPFVNRLLSLVLFSNGAAAFYLTSVKATLFQFWFYNNARLTKKLKLIKNLFVFNMLCCIKKLTFVSCVGLTPNLAAQYVRSAGTKAKLIKLDKPTKSALLQLPSKVKKIVSYYSSVFYEQLALPEKRRFTSTKAGY
jgi:ribosomal protein L2